MNYPKFILEDGNIIISKVKYHKDLTSNPEKVKGGGWFRILDDRMIFGGSSFDFGHVGITDLKEAIRNKKVFTSPALVRNISDKYSFYFDIGSTLVDLNDDTEKENSTNAPTSVV